MNTNIIRIGLHDILYCAALSNVKLIIVIIIIILHPKGQNILVGQIARAGGEFRRAAGEIPHHFIC